MNDDAAYRLNLIFQKVKWYSLLFIPITFLVLVVLLHYTIGKFYLQFTDPEYFHLFNGLNLSIFNLAIDYIDHPGTTVQVLYAVSAHVVNLILPGSDIITNAIENPEEFIHAANLLLNISIAITFFILGFYTYKNTKNIFLAWLMQFSVFLSFRLLLISTRILPESVLVLILIWLIFFIILYIYDSEEKRKGRFYVIVFAIISGLGVATKISYLPFMIIPLILLDNKSRWHYLLYSLIFIVVFAFPVFVNISKSWSWFGNMLLHSGKWGSGDANLIELQLVPQRLLALYKIDKNLFFLLGLGFIAYILTYFLPSLKNSISLKPKKRALLAVILALFFSILLITKHFANHYFIPNLVFKAFLLFLVTNIIISFIKNNRVENFIALAVFLIAIGFNIPQIGQLKASVKQKQLLAAEFEERERVLSTFNNKENILIISPHYRGSPFIQSAMAGGFMLSGQLRSTYKQKLIEKFPTTIMFVTWSDQFYLWDEFLDANEFIDPNNPVYIFIGEGKENHLKIIFDRISKHLPNCKVVTELLFRFEEPNEYFYKMSFLPKEKKILDKS